MSENNKVKKDWTITSLNGEKVEFYPEWKILDEEQEGASGKKVECQYIRVRIGEKELLFNYLDLYMFMYFTANEELRKNLAARYERKVYYIPYEVTFKLDAKEKDEGMAKRHIQLPVDDLTMAIARNEALKFKNPITGEYDRIPKSK